jgi:hypothetical protein
MERRGHAVATHGDWLQHRDSGIAIRPDPLEPLALGSSVRSGVIVSMDHPRFPAGGLYEYQYAVADTESEAIGEGLDQWLQMDFTVLLDALRERPENCNAMEWQSQPDESPEHVRRVLFGPVGHLVAKPEVASADAEHPFCPCLEAGVNALLPGHPRL